MTADLQAVAFRPQVVGVMDHPHRQPQHLLFEGGQTGEALVDPVGSCENSHSGVVVRALRLARGPEGPHYAPDNLTNVRRRSIANTTAMTIFWAIYLRRMDEIDLKILTALQDDARTTNTDLADRVGLSPAPCLRRVRALEQQGVIRKYATLLDPGAVNLGVAVFVQISLDLQVEDRLEKFERAIMRRPEVLECYLMTGDSDYLLRVVVPDVAAYERFLKDSLTRIEGVAGIKSSFALKQVKYSTVLPIDRGASLAPRGAARKSRGEGRSLSNRR